MSNRSLGLAFVTCAAYAALASLQGCGDESATAGAPTPSIDAGVDAPPAQCNRTTDCPRHVDLCVRGPLGVGSCVPPPEGGRCDPDDPLNTLVGFEAAGCYPDSRCLPVPRDRSDAGGLCSFQAPAAPLFLTQPGARKISLTAPNALSELRSNQGVSVQWVPPPSLSASDVLVALISKAVPQRESVANRVANPRDLVWIWSSTDPGASTTPGRVALEAGHRGLSSDGGLGPPYGRNTLDDGRYWWFVYAIRAGAVALASDVQPFRVGGDFVSVRCDTVSECTRDIPGELPDTVACIAGTCRRRCASDLDCPGVGGRCDFMTSLGAANDVPRGGYCSPTAPR